MGGVGSGRTPGTRSRSLTTDFLKLDLRTWVREGLLSQGEEFTWVWQWQDFPQKAIKVKVGDGEFVLDFFARTQTGSPYWVRQTISYSVVSAGYGGTRYFYVCPGQDCGNRVCVLYLADRFLCRLCLNLSYPSQNESPLDRIARKASKLRGRLGWEGGALEEPGARPICMHRTTYARLVGSYVDAVEAIGELLASSTKEKHQPRSNVPDD